MYYIVYQKVHLFSYNISKHIDIIIYYIVEMEKTETRKLQLTKSFYFKVCKYIYTPKYIM